MTRSGVRRPQKTGDAVGLARAEAGRRGRAQRLTVALALAWSAASSIAACGFDDPGAGSQTVKLQATIACAYPTLHTAASFALSQAGVPFENANVTLFDADSHERLEVPATTTPGSYAADWPGYHRRVQVHVWREADGMSFQVEGPSQHTIEAPRAGTVLSRSAQLKVRWRTTDGVRADEVKVAVTGAREATRRGGDGGKARFAARELGEGQHTLTVRRARVLVPAGGAPGSKLTASYAVTTPFVRVEDGPHD